MTYTVVWRPKAKSDLALLWVESSNPSAITRAADRIDSQLRVAPTEVGESREERYRILCVLPLAVAYHISESDRLVTVVRVRAIDGG